MLRDPSILNWVSVVVSVVAFLLDETIAEKWLIVRHNDSSSTKTYDEVRHALYFVHIIIKNPY